ncbi:hypothetical protein BMS3Abin14_00943 [bacterium BMS3Abin14]|nr:hypothetical protein BMS3Abin14_00943 [bacterium BMS3Abin14]
MRVTWIFLFQDVQSLLRPGRFSHPELEEGHVIEIVFVKGNGEGSVEVAFRLGVLAQLHPRYPHIGIEIPPESRVLFKSVFCSFFVYSQSMGLIPVDIVVNTKIDISSEASRGLPDNILPESFGSAPCHRPGVKAGHEKDKDGDGGNSNDHPDAFPIEGKKCPNNREKKKNGGNIVPVEKSNLKRDDC